MNVYAELTEKEIEFFQDIAFLFVFNAGEGDDVQIKGKESLENIIQPLKLDVLFNFMDLTAFA